MKPPRTSPFYGQPDARGDYRYWLHRDVGAGNGNVLFIMLNPSHALSLGNVSDDTIDRCIRYATSWGYRDLTVVNLFALRTPKPSILYSKANDEVDIVGQLNNSAIRWAIRATIAADGRVICAWGAKYCWLWCRNCYVLRTLSDLDVQVYCLGMTAQGHPCHPPRDGEIPTPILLPRWTYPYGAP